MKFDLETDKITIEKDGKEIDCDILFTFDCDETKKSYVGYSDNTIGEDGRKTIYVSSYNPENEEIIVIVSKRTFFAKYKKLMCFSCWEGKVWINWTFQK